MARLAFNKILIGMKVTRGGMGYVEVEETRGGIFRGRYIIGTLVTSSTWWGNDGSWENFQPAVDLTVH